MKRLLIIAVGTLQITGLTARAHSLSVTAWATFENEPAMPFQITRSGPSNFIQTVEYLTKDETALAGIHYIAKTGTVTFAVNQTTATIHVPLIDNGVVDGERTLQFVLTNPVPCIDIWPSGPRCVALPDNLPPGIFGCPPSEQGPTIQDNEFPPTRLDSGFIPAGPGGFVGEFPDGRILVWNGILLPDSSIDSSFVPGRGVAGEFGPIHVLSNGKILAMHTPPFIYQWRLVRLLLNGAVDPTFKTQPIDSEFKTELPDGRLLVVFQANIADKLVRLMPDGAVDPTFNSGITNRGRIYRAVLQPDGKIMILVLVDQGDGTGRFGVARLNSDGALDLAFARDPGEVAEFFFRSNGKILIKRRDILPTSDWEIVQLNADGSRDSTMVFPLYPGSTSLDAWVEQPDGRILIAQGFGLRRLNSDLSLDSSFAPDIHSPCTQVGHTGPNILITRSGHILFTGFFDRVDGFPASGFVRLRDVPPEPEIRAFRSDILSMGGIARIRVVRTGPSAQPASVQFATVDSSARGGTDYVAQSGTLNFASLETSREIQIRMLANTGSHSFSVQFTNPTPGYKAALIPVRVKTIPMLRIDSISPGQGGSVSIRGAAPNQIYTVQSSTDLKNWSSIYGSMASNEGEISFSNLNFNSAGPVRFYRVLAAD